MATSFMTRTPLGYSMPLKIKVLTPVHIGGDVTLSPLADYVLDNDHNVRYIDADKFAEAIHSTGSIERYINIVKSSTNEAKHDIMRNFAWHNLRRSIVEFYSETKIKSVGMDNPTLIDCCVKTNGLPYIPGSSLKGALRTCLLHRWLTSCSEESQKVINGFLDKILKKAKQAKESKPDSKKNKEMLSEISDAYQREAEEVYFGNLKRPERLVASCIHFTDTNTRDETNLAMYHLTRTNILSGGEYESKIPVIKECIEPGALFSATFKVDFYNQKNLPKIIDDFDKKEGFLSAINNYSLDVLTYEDELVKNSFVKGNVLRQYFNHTSQLRQEIENNKTSRAYLRLGFGKMQFYQTIAVSLFNYLGSDEENEDWVEYLKYCNSEMYEDIPKLYPETRVLTTLGQQPLGWVEIS